MTNSEKGSLGEEVVRRYLQRRRFKVVPFKGRGADLLAEKDGKKFKIEVKTSSSKRSGIPDMHDTEFRGTKRGWRLVADHLYIVRLDDKDRPVGIDVLSKAEVDRFAASHAVVTRIRTRILERALRKREVGRSIKLNKQ